MNGMEMMINAVMKATGVDPEKFKIQAVEMVGQINKAFAEINAQLAEIRKVQTEQHELMLALYKAASNDEEGLRDWRDTFKPVAVITSDKPNGADHG